MKVGVFQFNGCDKCFNETILLDKKVRVKDPHNWEPEKVETAIITGYLKPEDTKTILKIVESADKVIAYGSCAVSGGPFGLAYQKGNKIIAARRMTGELPLLTLGLTLRKERVSIRPLATFKIVRT